MGVTEQLSTVPAQAPVRRIDPQVSGGAVLDAGKIADILESIGEVPYEWDIRTNLLAVGRGCPYGNGASIFTRSGWAARQFKQHFNAGMIGINVGVPAPMAWFPFTGWNGSFFGDLHIQGTESIHFYTQQKMTMTRWFESPRDSHHDPVWKTGKG